MNYLGDNKNILKLHLVNNQTDDNSSHWFVQYNKSILKCLVSVLTWLAYKVCVQLK